jgi:DNA-binding NtrC family response regulator
MAKFRRETGKQITNISPKALEFLLSYPYPGNVRELENIIRRAVITADGAAINPGDIQLSTDFPVQISPEPEPFKAAKARAVSAFERSYLSELISACDGNVSKAARHAKKNRRALFALLKKYNMTSARQTEQAI